MSQLCYSLLLFGLENLNLATAALMEICSFLKMASRRGAISY